MVALSSFIQFHAQRTPERLALTYGADQITYVEMMRRIETTAGWLAAQGIGAGDVVALLMKNSPAFLELTFALSHLGAVSLPSSSTPSGVLTIWRACAGWSAAVSARPKGASAPSRNSWRGRAMSMPMA